MSSTDIAARNTATVASIYEAFGRGDIPSVLAELSDDVAWDVFPEPTSAQEAGLEHLQERRGPAEVGAFFASLAGLEFHAFEVAGLMAGGDKVAAELHVEIEVRKTGWRFRDTEVHLWTFDEQGRVTALRHVVDTAKHIAAHAN